MSKGNIFLQYLCNLFYFYLLRRINNKFSKHSFQERFLNNLYTQLKNLYKWLLTCENCKGIWAGKMQKVQIRLQKAVYCKLFTKGEHLHDYYIFKACVCYFLSNFYFSPNDIPSKTMKMFLFHQKSSFRIQDIQSFVFLSCPLFFPVSQCLRGWSKKNLNIYDVINCLNKNLVTHFVWYLEKEIRCDIETLSIVRELNKEHFYGEIM